VVKQPDFPGPGEGGGPDNIQAEANGEPIPDGEMLGVDPDQSVPGPAHDQRRHTLDMEPIYLPEANLETSEQRAIRQTGTERDQLRPVGAKAEAPEARLDQSVNDTLREDSLDPTQDESGPQSDHD
jgi:hypothetical protein